MSAEGVSVVLAAKDAARTLPTLLESLRRLDPPPSEICLCDDGSSDGTVEAARAAAGGLELRVARHETPRGPAAARNAAARLARNPLLLFVDADVRLPPDALARLRRTLERERADAVVGIYSPIALDDDPFSRYYAAFAYHSFLVADRPFAYDVFNAWCALCRREAWERAGGHAEVPPGVEIENESLGRRFTAAGGRLVLDPSVAADHHWGGHRKLVFIFTRRVYWWVKTFFASGLRFERCLTTPGYGASTLAGAAAVLLAPAAAAGLVHPAAPAAALAAFVSGYGAFFASVLRRDGAARAAACVPLSLYFSLYAAASAAYSAVEELARLALGRGTTADPRLYGRAP